MRVFISYRRSDSKDIAARIADNLALDPDIDHVFLDVDSIAHGEDFPERLDAEIAAADVVLAVIGPGWQGADSGQGMARLHSAEDFVRREIEAALGGGKRLIPCLVDGAAMPGASDLPASLNGLTAKNAIEVRHTSFRVDLDYLADSIMQRERLRRQSPARIAIGAGWRFVGGFVLAALIAILIAWTGVQTMQMPLETILGGRIVLVIVLLAIFAACQWGTWRFLRRFI